jgi:hypothetical protein
MLTSNFRTQRISQARQDAADGLAAANVMEQKPNSAVCLSM